MCYSAMQAQAAKNDLQGLGFKWISRDQPNLWKESFFPMDRMALGRLGLNGEREAVAAQFGLVPPWVTDQRGGPAYAKKWSTYNARSESVFERASFRGPILGQRAVVPVEAFFEVADRLPKPHPRYRVSRPDGKVFWFAALWDYSPKYDLTSCAILTVEPMELLAPFHSRSPVILDAEQMHAWLDPKNNTKDLIEPFLKAHSSDAFEAKVWTPPPKRR